MSSLLSRIHAFFDTQIWKIREDEKGASERALVIFLRLLHKIGQEFTNGEIPRRASSLVYRTFLTFIPILAVSFSVVKAFGVHTMLLPFISEFLAPLGEKGDEVSHAIVTYVDNINVGLLGMAGLAILIYTVISAVQQVEDSFNYLWQVDEERSLLKRFTDYMSALLVGPVLIVSALGITTFLMSHSVAQEIKALEPFGTLLLLLTKIVPCLLGAAAFTMVYYLLPNTKVTLRSALAGGLCAGVMWQAGSWIFARFVVSSTKYSAVYSGFAVILIFMIWLYYNWIIVLTGAKIAFYHQFPGLLRMRDDRMMCDEWQRVRLAIAMMSVIGLDYMQGRHSWTLPLLMDRLQMPKAAVQGVLDALMNNGLVLRVEPDRAFVPARDAGTIRLGDIASSVRASSHGGRTTFLGAAAIPGIEELLGTAQAAMEDALSCMTLADLIASAAGEGLGTAGATSPSRVPTADRQCGNFRTSGNQSGERP